MRHLREKTGTHQHLAGHQLLAVPIYPDACLFPVSKRYVGCLDYTGFLQTKSLGI